MSPSIFRRWIMAVRLPTLMVGAAPVIVGSALGMAETKMRNAHAVFYALLCLMGVLFLQMAANLVNDVADAQRGVDTGTRLGPIRVTQAGLLTPGQVQAGYRLLFILAVVLGVILAMRGGGIIVGLAGVGATFAYLYTGGPRPLSHLGMGELLAFIFFGPMAVAGCSYILQLSFGATEILLGSGSGLWAASLMAVNNYRDRENDRLAGKTTLAVLLSQKGAFYLPLSCMVVAVGIMAGYVYLKKSLIFSVILTIMFLVLIFLGVFNNLKKDPPYQNRALKITAALSFFYALCLAATVLT
jgi:1,4-dihydroxy-2-naphthoate octaprenyltransferase